MLESLNNETFEGLLSESIKDLTSKMLQEPFKSSKNFEHAVRESLQEQLKKIGSELKIDFNSHPQAFPDVCVGNFGVEVKYTEKDTWRGVANSISQGMRDETVSEIYVMWCKEGGVIPEIMYRRYEDVVMHVRTSHVPRFEIDMETGESLFQRFKITYRKFSGLEMGQKMDLVRSYVRNRIRHGEQRYFWFLESQTVDKPMQRTFHLFNELSAERKLDLALEEVYLFFPSILHAREGQDAFDTRVLYFINKHRVLYPQTFLLLQELIDPGATAAIQEVLKHEERGRRVFASIDANTFRVYANWWNELMTPSYEDWERLFRESITS